ncbi:unnamed protein product [Rhizoctonia solani]|uniref:Jacalin-type lectin domain-containing protein n=1 Tax=Rhizoctonia solani TaxID=456999 RepID=A0A8H3GFY7_9AGAM|nr:unnamed protein product [Rhizoctonia solani]
MNGADNNCNSHPPESDQGLDILAVTSLKEFQDKDILLRNIGYLCGIRVGSNDGPQNLSRRVAKFVGNEPPFIQEMNEYLTETISTQTERETNYIHHGWSVNAASTTSPWISSHIATKNQRNADGLWLTRRTLVQRFRLILSPEDLVAVPDFEAGIEAALQKPSVFQQFEATYRALHQWGDVVPLEIEMGASLVFTDLETNISQLPATATWNETHYLTAIRTARTTRKEGMNPSYWEDGMWPNRTIPPLQWRQTRIGEVVPTTRLLPIALQDQLSQLYAQRLSYTPAITRSDSTCSTHDDTPHASRNVSRITVYATGDVRSVTFWYSDKMNPSKHEGSETGGCQHEFVLTNGEYITEMLIWSGDWVYGLQFVTNFGRCTPNMGGCWNKPTVARCKGGILVGAVSLIKPHESGRLLREIQGIWRHDIIDKVPKEDDVFSDYFGSKKGMPFNDRVVVRNSDMAISKIEVRCGSAIDSIRLTYIEHTRQGLNDYQTERHGGLGGNKKQFTLENGEHIVSVLGKYNEERLTQLTFITDKGRTSETFGQGTSTGNVQSFSVSSPTDKEGKRMRLQYVCGKSDTFLIGIMFIWTRV